MNARLILSWIGAAMVGGALVAALGGAQRPDPRQVVTRRLVAESIVLRDEAGRDRIELNATGDLALIAIRDGRGKAGVYMTMLKDGSDGFFVYDRAGKPRIMLGVAPDKDPALVIYDEDQKPVASYPR